MQFRVFFYSQIHTQFLIFFSLWRGALLSGDFHLGKIEKLLRRRLNIVVIQCENQTVSLLYHHHHCILSSFRRAFHSNAMNALDFAFSFLSFGFYVVLSLSLSRGRNATNIPFRYPFQHNYSRRKAAERKKKIVPQSSARRGIFCMNFTKGFFGFVAELFLG